jgi:hypothetical protein
MPIEIKELVIRAVVGSKQETKQPSTSGNGLSPSDRKLIQTLEKTIDQLSKKNER